MCGIFVEALESQETSHHIHWRVSSRNFVFRGDSLNNHEANIHMPFLYTVVIL